MRAKAFGQRFGRLFFFSSSLVAVWQFISYVHFINEEEKKPLWMISTEKY